MLAFGQSWRTTHAVAAVMTAGAIMMTADFLFFRFLNIAAWRFAAALLAAIVHWAERFDRTVRDHRDDSDTLSACS